MAAVLVERSRERHELAPEQLAPSARNVRAPPLLHVAVLVEPAVQATEWSGELREEFNRLDRFELCVLLVTLALVQVRAALREALFALLPAGDDLDPLAVRAARAALQLIEGFFEPPHLLVHFLQLLLRRCDLGLCGGECVAHRRDLCVRSDDGGGGALQCDIAIERSDHRPRRRDAPRLAHALLLERALEPRYEVRRVEVRSFNFFVSRIRTKCNVTVYERNSHRRGAARSSPTGRPPPSG